MKTRHRARTYALQILYELDIRGRLMDAEIEHTASTFKLEQKVNDYCIFLVRGVVERLSEIDPIIERSSENWSLERMPLVDRNILRLGVFEFMHEKDVPFKVVIDEAVELAKSFGSEDSGAFVNGILDQVARVIQPEGKWI
ncbi:MAG: transcription antitermination factor NusB [Deltaproteobacteria bacterium]|nr:transcription antitermination factor NusB [Deltaproteobacteria bacterium]